MNEDKITDNHIDYLKDAASLKGIFKKDIVRNDDGYLVYWPTGNKGYLTSETLQLLADYLREQNSEWDSMINLYFENKKKKETQQ